MYDFIDGNGFKVADLEFKQNIDYTYFNIPRNINTWIDHIITTEYDLCHISSCRIIPLDSGNVSDHLPLRLCMNIHIDKPNVITPPSYSQNSSYFTNWSRGFNNVCYKSELSKLLHKISPLQVNAGSDNMQTDVDNYVNKAIRDGRPRPPRHQGFIAISYGGSELRHRSILETITHRPKCQIQKL